MRYVLLFLLVCTSAQAQVIYGDTPEQRRTGVYASTIIIKTDAESGMAKITEEPKQDNDIQVTSCVSMDDGECVQSDYFKATVTDVNG